MNQHDLLNEFEYKDGFLYRKVIPKNYKTGFVGQRVGYMHKTGYWVCNYKGKTTKVHRMIFLMLKGYLPQEIDHIDQDRANNKIENMREASRSENQFNKSIQKTSKSGFRGVSWHRGSQAWVVRVIKHGATVYQSYFKDLELAGLVAQEARAKFYGDFAPKEC